jgi:hypothetical protein
MRIRINCSARIILYIEYNIFQWRVVILPMKDVNGVPASVSEDMGFNEEKHRGWKTSI